MALRKPPQVLEQRQEVAGGDTAQEARRAGLRQPGAFPVVPEAELPGGRHPSGGAPRGRAGQGPLGA